VGENWQLDSATVLADCNCGLAAKKRKRRKKNNPSHEAADGLFFSSPTFDLSFPFYVLLRLLRFFAAKKASRFAKLRSETGHGASKLFGPSVFRR
jgi:hypothetical protein